MSLQQDWVRQNDIVHILLMLTHKATTEDIRTKAAVAHERALGTLQDIEKEMGWT